MKFEEFVEQVRYRAHLPSSGEAIAAIHDTLRSLAQRLERGTAVYLAAALPRRIAGFLRPGRAPRSLMFPPHLTREQFLEAVRAKEPMGLPDAAYRARVVLEVVREAVKPGKIQEIRALMPEDFKEIFAEKAAGK